eukprot:TRINITY_DN6903_c0_g1_i1.p2 TRINITY_DN6903_c0_g1~~TRINITY_DN6903_c0_g1_i1.p2  ORF type:complete len:111 (+),score=17.33 TRINITY_DN6903_c0_g1_i1:385-717(+)
MRLDSFWDGFHVRTIFPIHLQPKLHRHAMDNPKLQIREGSLLHQQDPSQVAFCGSSGDLPGDNSTLDHTSSADKLATDHKTRHELATYNKARHELATNYKSDHIGGPHNK